MTLDVFVAFSASLILAVASVGKWRNMSAFSKVVANYRVIPWWLRKPVTLCVLILEPSLAIWLISGLNPRAAFASAGVLFLGFAGAASIEMREAGTAVPCGCLGSGDRLVTTRLFAALTAFLGLGLIAMAITGHEVA